MYKIKEKLNYIINRAQEADKDEHIKLFSMLYEIHGGNKEICDLIDEAHNAINKRYLELFA